MDIDIGNLVYIIFVALILLVNLFTKKKKPQKQGPQNQNPETVGPVPVDSRKSFEELLEEFTRPQQSTPPPPKPKPVPRPTRVEPARPVQSKPVQKKEHSIMKTEYGRFDEFKRKKQRSSDIAKSFRDLDSAKKAFIYSEIFNRKY